MARLTPKQQRFVSEYLVDLNATAAAGRAGYKNPNKQGPRLMVNVGISQAITIAQKERETATGITAAWALARLKKEAEFEGDGASHSARVAALALAMKHLGMLKEDAPHPDRPKFDLGKLTDDAKRALLAGLRLALGRNAAGGLVGPLE